MQQGAASTFIEQARELPVMPPIAADVVRRAGDPDTDIRVISELISHDPGLALRVMRIANSSFYSMPREIQTIQQAIVLLGFSMLRSVVVAASLKDVFARFGLAERLLWDHAVAGAIAGATLAREVGGFSPDEAFIGGLVHDVGKLAMHSVAEDRYQEVTRAVYAEEADAASIERSIFGFDHAELGGLLLQKWELPARLGHAVGAHHDPESAADETAVPLAALLQVADLLCLQQGHGQRRPAVELNPLDSPGARILGIGDLDLEELIVTFKAAFETEKELFG